MAARCGGRRARFDGIAATSRASASCTRERTGNSGDLLVCSRGLSVAARGVSRRARAGDSRVGGLAASNGNAADCSRHLAGAKRGAIAATRGGGTTSRHRSTRVTSPARPLRCDGRRLTRHMLGSMRAVRNTVGVAPPSMNAVRNTVGAAPPLMHADRDPVAAYRAAVTAASERLSVAASASRVALDAMGDDRRRAARRRATACERDRIEPPTQRLENAARRSLSGDHDLRAAQPARSRETGAPSTRRPTTSRMNATTRLLTSTA
jgi:hypothetical protein